MRYIPKDFLFRLLLVTLDFVSGVALSIFLRCIAVLGCIRTLFYSTTKKIGRPLAYKPHKMLCNMAHFVAQP